VIAAVIPSLDELAGDWMETKTLRNYPSVHNFVGGLQSSQYLTDFMNLTIYPFAQSWGSGPLLLDGKPLFATETRWYPYEVRRRMTVDGVEMESAMRMPFEQPGVLVRLTMKNHSRENRTLNFGMKVFARIRSYPPHAWNTWGNARPQDGNFTASVEGDGKTLAVADKSSAAATALAFVRAPGEMTATGENGDVKWTITLAPGMSAAIEWAYALGGDKAAAVKTAGQWAGGFNAQFDEAKLKWEARWLAAFTPGNNQFSGHFPTLATDDPKIRRVYYEGTLVPLLLLRTNFPFSPRCFVTAGPQWANTIVYFWDTEMWANTWAMLEPATMKTFLVKWASMNHHACYAQDCVSGKGAGPWYAANDWSIFRCVEAYLGVTGDAAFLKQPVNGITVLQWLDGIATFYERRPLTKDSLLADYGGAQNLLECSPSYIQGVPALNAANVYMLRRVADYCEQSGQAARAAELRAKASKLLPEVMSLYKPGEGVWSARDKAGKEVPIRHCYDYITIGQALERDLTPQIKSEMNHFVESELLTKTWMRAMSLKDPAAANSDRPDHGPMGSYDGWPPMTMDVLCRFGDFAKAVAFLRATETITRQGPWAQAHEFLGPNARGDDPVVRTATRGGQDANEGCGAAFAEVIIRSFFGYRPDLGGDVKPVLLSPGTPRGFNGELRHVPFHGRLYTLRSDAQGIHQELEGTSTRSKVASAPKPAAIAVPTSSAK
jgi:hypothetical protein